MYSFTTNFKILLSGLLIRAILIALVIASGLIQPINTATI